MRSDSVFWIVFVLNYDTGFIALYSFRVLFPYVHYMTVWVCELLRSWPWLTLSLNKVKIKELRAVCLSLCQRSPCQQRGLRHHEEKRWGTHTHTHTSCENYILIIFGRMNPCIIPRTVGEETSQGVCACVCVCVLERYREKKDKVGSATSWVYCRKPPKSFSVCLSVEISQESVLAGIQLSVWPEI